MVKIEVNYDVGTGQLFSNENYILGTYFGLDVAAHTPPSVELMASPTSSVSEIIKLKDAGFTADEIISMKSRDVV